MTNPYKLEENTGIENRNISAVVKSVFLRVTSLKGNVKRRIPTRNEPKEASVSPIMAPGTPVLKKITGITEQSTLRMRLNNAYTSTTCVIPYTVNTCSTHNTCINSKGVIAKYFKLSVSNGLPSNSAIHDAPTNRVTEKTEESPQNNTLNLRITACPSSTGTRARK